MDNVRFQCGVSCFHRLETLLQHCQFRATAFNRVAKLPLFGAQSRVIGEQHDAHPHAARDATGEQCPHDDVTHGVLPRRFVRRGS